jgi:hypothetical protein
MAMNPEIKAQWVAALRSGDYEQGMSRLVTVRGDGTFDYCCLGVLCDLAVKADVPLTVLDEGISRSYDNYNGLLPQAVRDWAGFTEDSAIDTGEGEFRVHVGISEAGDPIDLAELNDGGDSFDKIAELIEAGL